MNFERKTLEDSSQHFINSMAPPLQWNSSLVTFLAVVSQTSSMFIPMFLLLVSVIEMDIKGILYIFFLIWATWTYKFTTKQLSSEKDVFENKKRSNAQYAREYICNGYTPLRLFRNDDGHMNQSVSTFVLVYTLAYLVTPMAEYGWSEVGNTGMIIVLIILILLDMAWKVYNVCTGVIGVLTGMLLGSIMGVLTWIVLKQILPEDTVIFFNRKTGANACKVKGKVKYRCDFEDDDDRDHIVNS